MTLLLTGMRALWPFLLIGPLIPLAILRPALDWPTIRRSALAAAIPLLIAAYLTHGIVEARIEAFVTGVTKIEEGKYDSSIGQRVLLWKQGVKKAAESPLVGSGPAVVRVRNPQTITYSHYHNFLLTAMVRSGIIGVLAVLALFAVPLWVLVPRARDDVGMAGLCLLLTVYTTFLLSGSVGIMLGHDIHDTLFIFGTILATFLIAGRQTLPATETAGGPAKQARL